MKIFDLEKKECPVCSSKLDEEIGFECGSKSGHIFSASPAWGYYRLLFYTKRGLYYRIAWQFDKGTTSLAIYSDNHYLEYKFKLDLNFIMDDFDFKDPDTVIQVMETYKLFV